MNQSHVSAPLRAVTSTTLNGTVALITGASAGIGRATARTLAEQGCSVALVARRADRLSALADDIVAAGGDAAPVEADICDAAAAEAAVQHAVDCFGRLDIVVNSAGVLRSGPSEESPPTDWDRMLDVNLRGLVHTTRAALPHLLRAAADGHRAVADVVNVSSVSGRFAYPGIALYTATKYAVTGVTESWRQEFTKRNVRFSVIEPGRVDTELFAQQDGQEEQFAEAFADVEILHADDVARAIAFIVTSPRRVSVSEVVMWPTDQA